MDGAYINIAFIELLVGGKLGKLVLVGIPKGLRSRIGAKERVASGIWSLVA